ncbi:MULTISPECIES: Lrp/AsnC family transcriptional regulator [unclassified Halobacterium]|jgi:Lrp/AsnC family transcriptional regulator for asnA, asnC and gidA|uniref:Lrp/AsnC family transcriptional regulator n=1 Tax=unclassified Halobacterium TaxID=2668073 RepID=UPI001E514A89|nr:MULTISPECIES: Lrp/AsnC family transcriptional regulator [unclassified Halobacterium]MCD2199718.1 Lrp/AsnC family transcriptional regulator [Halobacterium sp. KA-4]MCD2205177.1 Lrp/AsnC family transcriptional regulator [Halobacterium sp. KA-6]
MELDETDREILRALQADARKPFSEIAREIEMSSATVHDRVNRMEEAGVIRGYHADVDPKAAGLGTSAIVGLRVEQGREQDALDRLADIDGVQEIHLTTGEWDIILRVYAEDTDTLRELMFEEIADVDGFARSQTMVVLATEYESHELPL